MQTIREAKAKGMFNPKAIDPKTSEPKKRRKRKAADPAQIDMELIAKETS